MQHHLLQDLGLCIVSATGLAYLARFLRQPLLLAYIAAGVLVGPIGFGLITDPELIQTLAELGLAFLLFIVGLEIDVKKLVASGKVAAVATLIQVGGCAVFGWLVARALGFHGLAGVYIGAATAFSSTMIVVKLLGERYELDTLPGHLTLGILLGQDLVAIVLLAVQPELGGRSGGASPVVTIGLSVLRGLGLVGGTLAVSRWVLPALFRGVAKTPEAVLLSAVSWCFVVSYAATHAGFSAAMGALLAGVSMSAFPYSLEVVAKITTLRDFFVTLFFVSLGLLLVVPTKAVLVGTAILSLVVIVSRVVTVLPALRVLGFDNRIGVLCSLHLAQVSELALVIVLIGAASGHIGREVVSLVVLTLVVTSTLSTYLIKYCHEIALAFVKRTAGTILQDRDAHSTGPKHDSAPLILVGCFRIASSLLDGLIRDQKEFAVIDFNPSVHAELVKLGVKTTYGDVGYLGTLEHAGVAGAKVLVASIPDDFLRGTDNKRLFDLLRKVNPTARIIVTADRLARARELYQAGADYVLVPRLVAADRLAEVIELVAAGEHSALRAHELARLADRHEVVP